MVASVRPEMSVVSSSRAKALRVSEPPSGARDLSVLLAHDLKTPLAAIAMNLDFVLSELGPGFPDSLRSALEDSKEANARAVRIVGDMADARRLATGDRKPAFRDALIAPLIEAAIARVTPEASSRGLRILWSVGCDTVRVDPELFMRALERLLERAIRQASGCSIRIDHRGGNVTIRAECHREGACESGEPALATHFAEAVARALGGRFWAEVDGKTLSYRMALPLASAGGESAF